MPVRQLRLVRHAESASNAGLPTDSPTSNPITERGLAQAWRFANSWKLGPPQLIVTSPFIRTKLTAEPFLTKYPEVPHVEWLVHEWGQLDHTRYQGTTYTERHPHVLAHWERNDPYFRDGENAETLVELFGRVRDLLHNVASRTETLTVVFTHGFFIRAVLWWLHGNDYDTSEGMAHFRKFAESVDIPNVATLPLHQNQYGGWCIGSPHASQE
jgi:broad specificity phosphatase PhoE